MIELPGRSGSEQEQDEDFEAEQALRTLYEAEELKMSNSDILERVGKQIEIKREVYGRIEEFLGLEAPSGDHADQGLQTFLDRLRRSKQVEEFRTNESPVARRNRIANNKPKFAGPVLLTKFT